MALFQKYHLKDFAEYNKRVISWIKEHRYFSVRIGPPRLLLGISKWKRFNIYKNVLDKFIPLSDEFYIYDLNYDSDAVRPFHKHLLKDRSRYKIKFENNRWNKFDRLLYSPGFKRSITEIRGGIVGKCELDDSALRFIFKHCCDPIVIGNAGTSCGKNALNLAKNSEENGIFYLIIETLSSGLESITLVSNTNDILHIYDIASNSCKISRNYRNFHIEAYNSAEQQKAERI